MTQDEINAVAAKDAEIAALKADVGALKELRWALAELLDAIALPGHVVTRDEWERICLLSGRFCDPYLTARPDKLSDRSALKAELEKYTGPLTEEQILVVREIRGWPRCDNSFYVELDAAIRAAREGGK